MKKVKVLIDEMIDDLKKSDPYPQSYPMGVLNALSDFSGRLEREKPSSLIQRAACEGSFAQSTERQNNEPYYRGLADGYKMVYDLIVRFLK
jgi:hypothetical protein